jgi:enoyl-CoA hydratase/carnithine racemase
MNEQPVLSSIVDGIAELTLNRPERMNAYTWEMGQELVRHFHACDRDDGVRAIIVTGAGKAFCAGADLSQRGGATFDSTGDAGAAARAEEPLEAWRIRKPIIAAINGHAVGVGMTMPLQWDIRIAAADAKLSFAFVNRGVIPELASTWILPRLVGVARACELMMTGRYVVGEEAARIGLVNEAVPREQVLPRAREIARHIAEKSAPVSVAVIKRFIWEHLGVADPAAAMGREHRAFAWLGRQPDAREGVLSFVEKRPPQWSMTPTQNMPEIKPVS